jgi:hypothetical protein
MTDVERKCLDDPRPRASMGAFVQEMGWRRTSFGETLYVKVRREDGRPMPWTEAWETFSAAYPGRWAVQFFPPAEELVDEVNAYHLFVLEDPPRGVNINRR